MIEPIVKRIAGLAVHKMVVVGTVLIEEEDGSAKQETREFGTFKRDRRQMCQWLKDHDVELVAMESTGYTGRVSTQLLRKPRYWRMLSMLVT